MLKAYSVITLFLTPVGPGGVCHFYAEGRDNFTPGRFPVCLRTSRKVRIFHILSLNQGTKKKKRKEKPLALVNYFQVSSQGEVKPSCTCCCGAAWLSRGNGVNEA